MITTVIGAYPKPHYLKLTDWFNAEGGTDTSNPTKLYLDEISKMGRDAESIFLKATKEVINEQIECGIDVVTDGEIKRENYIHYHCRNLSGINFDKLKEKSARTGNYKCWLPTIVGKVEAKDPFLVSDYIVAQKLSAKPVKVTLPGPMTVTDTLCNEFYISNEELGKDLAKAINKEIIRLTKAGCKYIQIDEPLFARKPREALLYGIENLEKCFDGLQDSKIEKIIHICCGYPDKIDAFNYPKAPLSSYKILAERLENSIIDSISIEDAHRYNNLNFLEIFKQKKIILGLLKIASSEIETKKQIRNRIKEALKFIDLNRLIAAPDCGLGHLPRELAIKKLKVMVSVAKETI